MCLSYVRPGFEYLECMHEMNRGSVEKMEQEKETETKDCCFKLKAINKQPTGIIYS